MKLKLPLTKLKNTLSRSTEGFTTSEAVLAASLCCFGFTVLTVLFWAILWLV